MWYTFSLETSKPPLISYRVESNSIINFFIIESYSGYNTIMGVVLCSYSTLSITPFRWNGWKTSEKNRSVHFRPTFIKHL